MPKNFKHLHLYECSTEQHSQQQWKCRRASNAAAAAVYCDYYACEFATEAKKEFEIQKLLEC